MVQIEGTYTSVRSDAFADLYEKIGVPKDISEKLANSHWTMSIWKDGDTTWGYYFTCKEIPELNCVDLAEEGVEKEIFNPVFGGKSKMIFTTIENGFFTKFTSEAYGEYSCNETYNDVGAEMVWECDGKTYVDSWTRISPWTGSYVTVETKNLDEYFNGYSPELIENFKKYNATFKRVGDVFFLKENFEGGVVISSELKLDEEVKVVVPSKDSSGTEVRTAILTKKPGDAFLITLTDSQGQVDEWTATFSDDSLEWHGLKLSTKEECWYKLKKVNDFTGAYKSVAKSGFLEFAATQGISQEMAEEYNKFRGGCLEITELGDGWYKFTSNMGEDKVIDIKITDGENFEGFHPILREEAKGVASISENQLSFSFTTPKASMNSTFKFKGNYLINITKGEGSDSQFITVCERA